MYYFNFGKIYNGSSSATIIINEKPRFYMLHNAIEFWISLRLLGMDDVYIKIEKACKEGLKLSKLIDKKK